MWTTPGRLARAACISVVAAAVPAAAQDPAGATGTVIVTLGDGTSLPLHSWTLSYEYLAWKSGTSQLNSSPMRKDTRDLWVGKKVIPTSGASLSITYADLPRDSGTRVGKVAREIQMKTADGKTSGFKTEPPHKDLLLPGAERGWLIMPRSLDLKGETLTGTHKEYCLVSYSTLIECGDRPADQVVKLEFHP